MDNRGSVVLEFTFKSSVLASCFADQVLESTGLSPVVYGANSEI